MLMLLRSWQHICTLNIEQLECCVSSSKHALQISIRFADHFSFLEIVNGGTLVCKHAKKFVAFYQLIDDTFFTV